MSKHSYTQAELKSVKAMSVDLLACPEEDACSKRAVEYSGDMKWIGCGKCKKMGRIDPTFYGVGKDRVLTSVGLEMQVAESDEELLLYEYAFDRAEEVDGELVLKDDGESGVESDVESE